MPRLDTGSLFDPIVICFDGVDYPLRPLTAEVMSALSDAEKSQPDDGEFDALIKPLVTLGIPREVLERQDIRILAKANQFVSDAMTGFTKEIQKNA